MFAFVWFLTFCILGESEGENKKFPFNWTNKDFTVTSGNVAVGFWNFSESIVIQQIGNTIEPFEYIKIDGRFLLIRHLSSDLSRCFAIKINNADSFTAIRAGIEYYAEDLNMCTGCSIPLAGLLELSAVDTVAQNQAGPQCNVPEGCTPHPDSHDPIVCSDKGSMEGDVNEATTSPPPSPTKRCRHRHP